MDYIYPIEVIPAAGDWIGVFAYNREFSHHTSAYLAGVECSGSVDIKLPLRGGYYNVRLMRPQGYISHHYDI